jgi:thiosulfate/3-mercaptopyruvate sulfurtransferase
MKRYLGEVEPIDPVAGHIPGAVCYPFTANLKPDGKWHAQVELHKRFESIGSPDAAPVFYCGSGVTACHNILAYKIATGRVSRLYPGSWSEWLIYEAPAS